MALDHDATEFVDGDLQTHRSPPSATPAGAGPLQRAPTREEVAADLAKKQQELATIVRAKEEKERERAALEETRRRQTEFHTGREETIQNLTRGVGLLEEAEFGARREVEQMAKALVGLRDALAKVQAVREETWTKDNFNVELTRALTALENARMEWNTARLKFPVLTGTAPKSSASPMNSPAPLGFPLAADSFGKLCRVGLALTWPLAAVALVALAALLRLLMRH